MTADPRAQLLRGMAEKLAARAAENFNKDGRLMPVLIAEILDEYGKNMVLPIPMPWRDEKSKQAMTKAAAEVCRSRDCQRYVFISEVWFKSLPQAAGEKFIKSKLAVSDFPDKEERIAVIAEDVYGNHVFLTIKITRLSDGTATAGAVRDQGTNRMEFNLLNGIFPPKEVKTA